MAEIMQTVFGVLIELAQSDIGPDPAPRWYAMLSAQMAHTLIGVSLALYRAPALLVLAVFCGWLAKELLGDIPYPPLIRGDDLRNYITAQRESRKVKTGLCEFYCPPCRKSHSPAGGMADCKVEGNKAMLTALCGVCERIVSKPISLVRLPEISSKLDLTITRSEVTL